MSWRHSQVSRCRHWHLASARQPPWRFLGARRCAYGIARSNSCIDKGPSPIDTGRTSLTRPVHRVAWISPLPQCGHVGRVPLLPPCIVFLLTTSDFLCLETLVVAVARRRLKGADGRPQTKRPIGLRPLQQRRSCGRWSWQHHRSLPEEFPQSLSPGPSPLSVSFPVVGFRIICPVP